MALAMVWVTFAQTLALHGTGQAIIQRDEVDESHYDAAFWTTVGGSLLLAAVFAGVAPFLAKINGTPQLTPGLPRPGAGHPAQLPSSSSRTPSCVVRCGSGRCPSAS